MKTENENFERKEENENEEEKEEEEYDEIHWLAYNDNLERFILLYNLNKEIILKKTKKRRNNCLHLSSVSNSKRILQFILEINEKNLLINEVNKWNETPLHVSIAANNSQIVLLLLQNGADYNLKDLWGRTPKTICKQYGHKECLEILNQFDTSLEDNNNNELFGEDNNNTILEEIQSRFQDITKEFLEVQKKKKESNKLNEVIEKHMFDTTIYKFQNTTETTLISNELLIPSTQQPQKQGIIIKTSLSKLVEYPGDPDQLRIYLEDSNINPGSKDMLGYTALHKFVSWNKLLLVEILLPYLTTEQIMCKAGGLNDQNQFTILHLCVEMKSWDVLDYLLSNEVITRYSIDINMKDKKNRTYLQLLYELVEKNEIERSLLNKY